MGILLGLGMNYHDDSPEGLENLRDFLRWAVTRFHRAEVFYGHGTDNAWDEALYLVNAVLALPPEGDERFLDARLTIAERHRVSELVARRVRERVPVPYLTGEAWFAGLRFRVDERVLIPRSPIAELIERGFRPWLARDPDRVLDLCAGSGCIGITCAYAFPEARVDLSDICPEALTVAEENIALHHLQERVEALESDLFQHLDGRRYDLIVSNPPYVDREEMAALPPEFHHEPALALASGDDGLDFTRRLLREAPDYLTEEGVLVVEVGHSRHALEEAFPGLAFTWMDFERGGEGVFVLHREDLVKPDAQRR